MKLENENLNEAGTPQLNIGAVSCSVVHCKKAPYDVYIGRPSKWGNPFTHLKDGKTLAKYIVGSRDEAVEAYREWITNGEGKHLMKDLPELKNKVIACWCKPQSCHGDVLSELVAGIAPNVSWLCLVAENTRLTLNLKQIMESTKPTSNEAENGNKSKPLLPAVFSDLLVEHDYYCSDSAYHNLGFETDYKNFKDFYNEMGNSDDDMNLVFRFDIKTRDENEIEGDTSKYFMEIFMVHQRKGRFVPFFIENVYETDFELIKEYLERKYSKIKQLWSPFTSSLK